MCVRHSALSGHNQKRKRAECNGCTEENFQTKFPFTRSCACLLSFLVKFSAWHLELEYVFPDETLDPDYAIVSLNKLLSGVSEFIC
jgi:hypothetical protein